ncbi:NUDIX hydrolase [Carnobacterium funditum]|uniref:NUDIX hydrolase n=1 Tax=Carnobacterium funditum TaxID=2752 RepID=UPI000553F412|nr:NUDIX hydrolase [Carnobacterium funditum]
MEFNEETIKSQRIYKGNITEYWVEEVLLPNGKKANRELVKHAGAVAIMPFTADGKMIFVKQFRKAIEKTILEIPAGMIDKTDDNPIETGKRELEEETGFQAKVFELETSFYTSPGFSNEFLYIYRAEELTRVDQPLAQDEDEFLELVTLSFEEAWVAYEKKLIIDSKTVFALFYWKMKKEMEQKNR